jgi:hypothetical protein
MWLPVNGVGFLSLFSELAGDNTPEAAASSPISMCFALDWMLASVSVELGECESDRAGEPCWRSVAGAIASRRDAKVVSNWICHLRVGMSCEMATLCQYCPVAKEGNEISLGAGWVEEGEINFVATWITRRL